MEFEIYSDKKLAYEMKPKYFKFDARPLQSTLWNTSLSHPCGHESLYWNGTHVKLKAEVYFYDKLELDTYESFRYFSQ